MPHTTHAARGGSFILEAERRETERGEREPVVAQFHSGVDRSAGIVIFSYYFYILGYPEEWSMFHNAKEMLLIIAIVIGLAVPPSYSANAACFESGVGCPNDHYIPRSILKTLSCDALWIVRNSIFDERGFCFKSARALETFSNEGCYVTDASRLNFNAFERTNIDRIVALERQKGCR